ncbi:MAG: diguanylate cyclase [Phycisphaerales bacterium]
MTSTQQSQLDQTPVVLLVDDSEFVHRLLNARLKTESISIVSAVNGEEGLRIAKEQLPALILLDLEMPVMDGFETLRQLMEDPATRNIPVIVLSGQDTTQDKVTAFDLGASDFVSKPFELTELRARLRSALRISTLLRMLEQRAQIDGLTGLYNRSHFDMRWKEVYESSIRHGKSLSLVMIDIDNFKSVNDTFGHPAGDAVISGMSNLLLTHLRASDIACRYGGEEFALILPDTTPDDAKGLCDRIRIACEEISWPRHPERKITISMGISGCVEGPTLQSMEWIEHVDANLYQAKERGRNRIVCDQTKGQLVKLPKAG